jgi:fibronectin type 3 domain-containing protein
LNGKVDDAGHVSVHWKPNPDSDILGYRVYRAYYKSEEFALMTGDPIKDTLFTDKVELKNLNEKIHYRIMAIDRNQNHSGLSDVLSLSLPDKVPPMPPVWLPAKSTKEGVVLRWIPSGSLDVTAYEVYRKGDQGQWLRIKSIASGKDSVYTYTDRALRTTTTQYYTVVAVDEAGLESPPTPAVSGFMLAKPAPAVGMTTPAVDREKKTVTLRWSYALPEAVAYRVYRKKNTESLLLYRTVKEKQFMDTGLIPGSRYEYQVMAVLVNGALSEMGTLQEIDF